MPNPATVKLGFFFGAEQPLGGVGCGTTGAIEHHSLSEVNIVDLAAVLRGPWLGRLASDLAAPDIAHQLTRRRALFAFDAA